MPLESLLELVKTLSDRIDEHGPALRQSEALTRYALIDPLLRELGWDTEDPDMVIPEYRSGNGRADYALMSNGSPAVMVEAKSLGTNLGGGVLSQGIQYCLEQGTRFFCVTDGSQWEIYETHRPVPIDRKQMVSFNLKSMPPSEVCLKALALWRYSVETGQVIEAQTPISSLIPDQSEPSQPKPTEEIIPQLATVVPVDDRIDWRPLSDFNPDGSSLPTEILFPDGTRAPTPRLRSVIIEVARWLINNDLLNSSHCPVQLPNASTTYVVNNEPYNQNGTAFQAYEQMGIFYINTHGMSSNLFRKTRNLIQHMGQDPAQFKIRLP